MVYRVQTVPPQRKVKAFSMASEKSVEQGGSKTMKEYTAETEPKAYADGVPVYCAHDEVKDTAALVPNPKNPNTHPDEQIQLLGRIIRQT